MFSDHPINIGDYQLRPAWKAVHIGLPMQVTAYILGTIVTRMCAVMHVSKLQPGRLYLGLSLHSRIIASKAILQELNVEVKPSRLLSACIPFRGLRYACPRLPTSVKPMCIAFQASLGCPSDLSGEPLSLSGNIMGNSRNTSLEMHVTSLYSVLICSSVMSI